MRATATEASEEVTTTGAPEPAPTTVPPEEPTAITLGFGTEPTSLDPQLVDQLAMFNIAENIFEKLLTRDAEGALVPGLATDLGTSLDDTTWQFTLREGVSFHNGEPFNADAVVHSVNRILNPDLASELTGQVQSILGAEKVDEYTVNILTDGPDPILPARLAAYLYIVPPEASASEDFGSNPVGTGPYVFTEWVRGQSVSLEANDNYWNGRPSVDQATVLFFEEYGTRLAALLAGEVDLMLDLQPDDLERAAQSFLTPEGLKQFVVILNAQAGSPIEDVRIRQALNYAVDKEAIANDLFQGTASPLQGQMLNANWFGFNSSIEPYPYDPDMARSLLEDAGAVGMSIQLYGVEGNSIFDRETTEVVAGYWNAVGLETEIIIPEFSEYIDRLIDRESRPTTMFVPHDNFIQDADRTYSSYYHGDGCCGSMDVDETSAQIDEARTELDLDRRQELYEAVGQRGFDDAWYVYLVTVKNIYGATDRVVWSPRADGLIHINTIGLTE